jgi:hypothetical protein
MKSALLSRIANEAILYALSCMCFSKAGLAEGTNANTFQIAALTQFSIDGIMYSKAITDNIAMSTTNLAVHGPSQRRAYLVQIDAAGNVTTKQGNSYGDVPAPGSGNDNGVAYVPVQGIITAITNAYQPRVNSTAHTRQTGDTVQLNGITGPSVLNGQTFTVRRVDANNFDLLGVDGRLLPAYVSGGYFMEMETARAAIGAIIVETDSVTTFTPGSTDLGAAGVTDTYMDFSLVPFIRKQ